MSVKKRLTSNNDEEAYLGGKFYKIDELGERYSLALAINNNKVMKILAETKKPLSTKELTEKLGLSNDNSLSKVRVRMKKLFEEKLVVRFKLYPRGMAYLLSRKGFEKFKACLSVNES